MPIQRKTAAEFAVDIGTAIQSRNSDYDTRIGPVPDLVINPMAAVLELQHERVRSVQQLLSLQDDGSFTSQDIDEFVKNEGLLRLQGGRSRVTLVFSRAAVPTVDLTVRANFPVSTLPDEVSGSTVTFITSADATLVAAQASAYFNPVTQRYELQVPAISLATGIDANIGPNRAKRPLRPLVGFDSVSNADGAIGGRASETNSELIERYFVSLTGTSPTTIDGITKILRNLYPSVIDSYAVYGNNSLNVRSATDGGAIDVYTIGDIPTTITESVVFTGVGQVLPLKRTPVLSLTGITGYSLGVDFLLSSDTTGVAGSVRAIDGVYWLSSAASTPAIGTTLNVTYTYNSMQTVLQSAFATSENDAAGRDILFKQGSEKSIVIAAQLKPTSGFIGTTVVSLVNTAILDALDAYKLNQDVELSDIDLIARSFSGVDNFIITQLSLVGGSGVADIPIAANEYATLAQANLVITLI
jgi:uncharacterized phage protein gp47/JayE